MKSYMRKRFAVVALVLLALPALAQQVPVGTYLYAKPEGLEKYAGALTLHFAGPGPQRLVIAYGRQYRKDRTERKDTAESQREFFKPYKANLADNGKTANFPHLPPDYYDILVIDVQALTLHEGIDLLDGENPSVTKGQDYDEVNKSLSPTAERIGGWEAFFDTKQFERLESDGTRGCMLAQQLRKGPSFAESGAAIQGCIHSIDICWVERTLDADKLWHVITRQQLFRQELATRDFFKHVFCPELQGIRVGATAKELEVKLPAP